MTKDDKFMSQIAGLQHERAPEELYDRIMTVVPHLVQASPEGAAAPVSWLERFFGEWSYGLGVKFASLVILGILGFCVGHLNGPSAHQDSLFSQIITGSIGWED
jgi:hypothetical protein